MDKRINKKYNADIIVKSNTSFNSAKSTCNMEKTDEVRWQRYRAHDRIGGYTNIFP